jgi:hypothetical protein
MALRRESMAGRAAPALVGWGVGVIDERRGRGCLGSDEGAERGKRGASGSLKPAGSRGEKDREMGRGQLGPRPRGERRRGGGSAWARGGLASWTDMTWMWQLWADPTAAGSARLVGAAGASGDGRGRLSCRQLTGGAGRQWSLVVSGRVWEGESKSEAVAVSAPTGGPRPHSAGGRNSTRFELKQNSTGFKLILN